MANVEDQWPTHSRFASIALASAILLAGIGRGWLAASGGNSSYESDLVHGLSLSLTFEYWLERDTRKTQLIRVWDSAWFFFSGWPVLLPYYLFKTRGTKRALATIFAWLGLYLLATLNAVVIGVLWSE